MAETKDRLPVVLVSGPMTDVREQGLAAGERAFDKLLAETRARHGPNSAQAADLLMSFGVQLYIEDPLFEGATGTAALKHLSAAIPAYRAAFGPNHPEVALALNTYAEAEWKRLPDNPPPEVESLLTEALRIREDSLGPSNAETVATRTLLARLYALPLRLQHDPERLSTADSYLRSAIAGALRGPEGDERSNAAALQIELATLHARSGDPRVALIEARKALAISRDWKSAERRCQLVELQFEKFVELMSARGLATEADAIRPKGRASACNPIWEPSLVDKIVAILRRLFERAPA